MTNRSVYPYDYERRRAQEAFAHHKMTIELDTGLHRSIRFAKPGTNLYAFRLTTWPGHLCISGDLETFVFARLPDMFEFFIRSEDPAATPLRINPGYWHEKLQTGKEEALDHGINAAELKRDLIQAYRAEHQRKAAADGRARIREKYSAQYILQTIDRDETADEVKAWAAPARAGFQWLRNHVLEELHDDLTVAEAYSIFDREWSLCFDHIPEDHGLDIYDYSDTRHSFHFLFSCYAIVWGIKRYYQAKDGRTQTDHDRAVLSGSL